MAGGIYKRTELRKTSTIFPTHDQRHDDFMIQDDQMISILNSLASKGAIELTKSNKYRLVVQPFSVNQNWLYLSSPGWADCSLWHDVIFDHFGMLPIPCMDCWKVVIVTHPDPSKQTVLDLFKMREYLKKSGLASKCGVDSRVYTSSRYSGYIYNKGFEAGLEVWNLVNETIRRELPDAKVILKRSCTEYEHCFGRSDRWDKTIHCRPESQQWLLEQFEQTPHCATPQLLRRQKGVALRYWIEYAYGIGDETWRDALKFTGYDVDFEGGLFPSCLEYQHLISRYRQEPESVEPSVEKTAPAASKADYFSTLKKSKTEPLQ